MLRIDDRGFSPALLSLRGIAAIMVLLFHGLLVFRVSGEQTDFIHLALNPASPWDFLVNSVTIYLLNGHAAVIFFFVHSGFVLALSISHYRFGPGLVDRVAILFAYIVRRTFRLWPMIIVSCLCALSVQLFLNVPHNQPHYTSWLAAFYTAPVSFRNVSDNLLLQDFNLSPFLWSLRVEVYGSVMMPLIFLLSSLYLIPAILLPILLSYFYPPMFDPFLVCFVGGCLVGYVGYFLPGKPSWLNRDAISACAVLVLVTARWVLPIQTGVVVQTLASMVIIYNTYYYPGDYLPRFCNLPFVRFIGLVSFSIYANSRVCIFISAILLTALLPGEFILQHGLFANWLATLLSLVVTIAFSWFTFRFIEAPMMQFGRRLSQRNWLATETAKRDRRSLGTDASRPVPVPIPSEID
jgi:peptidoglycan/LPS O-acetylase OafA/YrhL